MGNITLNKSKRTDVTDLAGTLIGLALFVLALLFYMGKTIFMFFLALGCVAIAFTVFIMGKRAVTLVSIVRQVLTTSSHISLLNEQESQDEMALGADHIEDFEHFLRGLPYEVSRGDVYNRLKNQVLAIHHVPADMTRIFNEHYNAYSMTYDCLEYVANNMPLFGLIGTLVEMLQIFGEMDDSISIGTLAPQIKLAFSCTMIGALYSAVLKVLQSRVSERQADLASDYDRLESEIKYLSSENLSLTEVERAEV